jgi:hypothetical protein
MTLKLSDLYQTAAAVTVETISDWPETVTPSEIEMLDGLTAPIQAQLNQKVTLGPVDMGTFE